MYSGFSLLALIPARGGSKGLPNKNILECAGRPLIGWTIAAARESGLIDDVLVSTDAPDIAAVARRMGASVPFMRPAHLATDDSSMLDVMAHAWEEHLDADGRRFDYVVLLQPTSPLRTSRHIRAAIKLYFSSRQGDDDTLASVFPVGQKHGWLMQTADDSGYVRFCMDVRAANPQRQKLKPYYLPNGAIFVVKGTAISGGLYRENTLPFIMDVADSIDIDTREDFQEAEEALLLRVASDNGH